MLLLKSFAFENLNNRNLKNSQYPVSLFDYPAGYPVSGHRQAPDIR